MINVVRGLPCVVFAVGIMRALFLKRPLTAAVAAARSAVASAPAVIPAPSAAGPETYASITAQNLFYPVRGETAAMAALAVVKPILHGVVIEGAKSRAFLEAVVIFSTYVAL